MSNVPSRRSGFGSLGYAALAILCAGFAAFLLATVLKAKGYKAEKKAKTLIAVNSIPAGAPLAREDVKEVEVAATLVPADAVTSVDVLFPKDKAPPIASSGIIAGEFILQGRLADAKKGTAMAGRVRPGYRAIAVTVDKSIGRSRLVFPGAHVDVVGTFRDAQVSMSRLLIENAQVLSLESQTDVETVRATEGDDAQNANKAVNDTVVTLEVTPAQAEVVALAAREGKIDLVLRNATDVDDSETPGATTELLFSGKMALDELGAEVESEDGEKKDEDSSRRSRSRRSTRSQVKRHAPQMPGPDKPAAAAAAAAGIEVISVKGRRR